MNKLFGNNSSSKGVSQVPMTTSTVTNPQVIQSK